jgi:hypothetical protein
MKIKKYKIPIYEGNLIVVIAKSMKEVEKKFNLLDTADFDACVFKDRKGNYVAAFENTNAGIVAHESLHIVNFIFKDRHISMDLDNDEPQCYLIKWIVDKITKVINSKK